MPVIARPRPQGWYGRVASFFGFAEPFTPVPLMTHRQFARAILPLFGKEVAEQSTKIPPRVMALVKRIPKSVVRSVKRIEYKKHTPRTLGRGGEIAPSWWVKALPKEKQAKYLGRARYVRRAPIMRLFWGGKYGPQYGANLKTPFHEVGHELESFLLRDWRIKKMLWDFFRKDPSVVKFQRAAGVYVPDPHEVLAETAARRIFKKAGWEEYGRAYDVTPEWAKWAVEEAIKRAGGVP